MKYEINIAKKNTHGQFVHWARVTLPEGLEKHAIKKFVEIEKLFPEEQGFKLGLSLNQTIGEEIVIDRKTLAN